MGINWVKNMELVKVCAVDEVNDGTLKSVDVEGVPLMITKLAGDYIVASRICTHKTYDLTKGHYEEGYITCMLHTSVFDLSDDAEPMNPPATEALETYNVVVKDNIIYIEL